MLTGIFVRVNTKHYLATSAQAEIKFSRLHKNVATHYTTSQILLQNSLNKIEQNVVYPDINLIAVEIGIARNP